MIKTKDAVITVKSVYDGDKTDQASLYRTDTSKTTKAQETSLKK